MIEMTVDFASNYEEKKIPMLDLQVWMNESVDQIYYEYYEKQTKSSLVISKNSAMPLNKKIDTLSQGVFRRLHNTKREIDWESKAKILEKFMFEIKCCGYSQYDRYQILKSGVSRYERLCEKEKLGIRPFYRKQTFQKRDRKVQKEQKKTNWFSQKNNKFSSVFFVPPTPGSILLNSLKKKQKRPAK